MHSKFDTIVEKVVESSKYGLESVFINGLDFNIKKNRYGELDGFLQDCVFIKDAYNIPCIFDGVNILDETAHPEVKYGNSILQKLKNRCSEDLQCFNISWLKEHISKAWKYYDKLSNVDDDIKVFYIYGDFANPRQMLRRILTTLMGESYKNLSNNEDFDELCRRFSEQNSSFQGFFYNEGDIRLLCFNKASFTVKTVSHEMTHLMQSLLNVNLLKEPIAYTEDERLTIMKHLQLSEDDLKYVFRESEFWTIVFNDLHRSLQILYRIQLKEWKTPYKTFNDFIDYVKFVIEDDPHRIMTSEIGTTWMSHEELNSDSKSLRLLAVLKIIGKDVLFNEVFDRLHE